MSANTLDLAARVLGLARQRGMMIATAESCTGGMIAAALTDIAGSSDVFDRGFVTYSNEAKMDMLGVRATTLDTHGAVSGESAREMAQGALMHSRASVAISVTGVAGPGGGSAEKPVGLVWFGLAMKDREPVVLEQHFGNLSRAAIRQATVWHALIMLRDALDAPTPDQAEGRELG